MKKTPITNAAAMSKSVNALFDEDDQPSHGMVHLEDIIVKEQDRTVFEDEDNSLRDLGESLKKRWAHPVIINVVDGEMHLVAGERRVKAAQLVGINPIPVRFFNDLTKEEVADLQTAENIQRKNLENFEVAKRIRSLLDKHGGDYTAVSVELNKPKPYLSKMLALLSLGSEARALVDESLSNDLEVLVGVNNLAKKDPVAAKTVVDTLRDGPKIKEAGGKKPNARDVLKTASDAAKPGKKQREIKREKGSPDGGSEATPRDDSHQQPSAGRAIFGAFGSGTDEGNASFDDQSDAHTATAQQAVDELSDVERTQLESRLIEHWHAGRVAMTEDPATALLQGMQKGLYGKQGDAALRLAAFVQGVTMNAAFELEQCVTAVKEAGSA